MKNSKKSDYYKNVGHRIKKARERKDISQIDLATKIGFKSATAISLIESGERKISVSDLEKLVDILDIELKYFFEENYKKPSLRVALRADENLAKEDKDKILDYYNFIKSRKKKDE